MKKGILMAGGIVAGRGLAIAFFTVAQPAWENMKVNATTYSDDGVSLSDRAASADAQGREKLGL